MGERMNKINHELQRILSDIILHEISHPEVQPFFYTVTSVKCSTDLHHAQVFISVLGDAQQVADGFKMLCRRLSAIQRLFAPRVHLKYTPKLFLKLDDTALKAERIQQLLHQVKSGDATDE